MADKQTKPTDPSERAAQRSERKRARRSWRLRQREKNRAAKATSSSGEPQEQAPQRAETKRRMRRGVVVSAKSDKTITVRIDRPQPHRIYKKVVRTSATVRAHDEQNDASEGDTVRVVESRPRSRSKRWRLVEVVERAR